MSKRLVRLVIIILLVLIAIGGGLYLGLHGVLNLIPRIDPEETFPDSNGTAPVTASGESSEPGQSTVTTLDTEPAETIPTDDDIVTVLLIGNNEVGAGNNGTSNTIMLCTVDKSAKKLSLTSFHSDLWVYIPNYGEYRLSMAGKLGGTKLVNETLEHTFGIKADHTVMIDLLGFATAIDTIGGVEVTLLEGEALCLNNYAVRESQINETWHLKTGQNTLTGTQALAYARMEESGTDFGRTNRQRVLISSMVLKLKNMNMDNMARLVKSLIQMVATDMTNEQIIDLIADVVPMLSDIEIVSQNIPIVDTYTLQKKNGIPVLIMSKEQLQQNIQLLSLLYE